MVQDAAVTRVPVVLLVEDDEQVRGFIRTLLVNNHYKVVEARNGSEGLKVARELEGSIDLLLSDMLLPALSGFDLAEQLREQYPELKILFISGYVEGEIVQRSMTELGATFLDKPFQPAALLQRVIDVIGPASSSSAA